LNIDTLVRTFGLVSFRICWLALGLGSYIFCVVECFSHVTGELVMYFVQDCNWVCGVEIGERISDGFLQGWDL
jgi:hypothetical protein